MVFNLKHHLLIAWDRENDMDNVWMHFNGKPTHFQVMKIIRKLNTKLEELVRKIEEISFAFHNLTNSGKNRGKHHNEASKKQEYETFSLESHLS